MASVLAKKKLFPVYTGSSLRLIKNLCEGKRFGIQLPSTLKL